MKYILQLNQVRKRFGQKEILKGMDLRLEPGKIGCLLGTSACGKTTVLRAIAGFESIHSGEIWVKEKLASRSGWSSPPEKRQVGLVFQDSALFPHLTVRENIAFGLHKLKERDKRTQIENWLDTMSITEIADAYPHEISGGQKQRTAVARAMAPNPDLLLLDEPFANLDTDLRERLANEIRKILKEHGTSALLVTHDQYEAFAFADEIGVMHLGRMEQWASSYDLYHQPATQYVADFIGHGVFLPGNVHGGKHIEIELGKLPLSPSDNPSEGTVEVLLRPDDVVHDDASKLQAQVLERRFRGANFLYKLKLPSGRHILSEVPSHHDHPVGTMIGIRLEADHVIWFPNT